MSQNSADPALPIQANGVQRYVPSMSALRVACRTPWGTQCDLVVLRGHVIVPRELAHARALWWVRDEKHPGLAVAPLSVLERQTGAEIGVSPYCVPVERWNEATKAEPWLPIVSTGCELEQSSEVTASQELESLALPNPARGWLDCELDHRRSAGDRLREGSHAVSRLLVGVRRVLVVGALAVAVLACANYLAATAVWLWNLQQGMTGASIEQGVMLIFAALLLSALTGLFRERVGTSHGVRALPYRGDGRERQPVLYTVLDGYRLGIALQLLAFGAFVIL
jgi:hypothetical protein